MDTSRVTTIAVYNWLFWSNAPFGQNELSHKRSRARQESNASG